MVQLQLQTKKLHLGCGRTILDGWVNLDWIQGEGIDVVADLDGCGGTPLPFEDDVFDEAFASHLIEHIRNPLPMMQELHRVCVNGAKAVFRCPHGASDDAFEDPTHVRQYFPNSFMYFSQPAYWRADYGYRGDWQVEDVALITNATRFAGLPPQEIVNRVHHYRNVIDEMVVTLRCVKPIREPIRELLSVPTPRLVQQRSD
jgi:SAM-dependent methyltransferase